VLTSNTCLVVSGCGSHPNGRCASSVSMCLGACSSCAASGTKPSMKLLLGGLRTPRRRIRLAWTDWPGRLGTGRTPGRGDGAARMGFPRRKRKGKGRSPVGSPPAPSGSRPIVTTSPCRELALCLRTSRAGDRSTPPPSGRHRRRCRHPAPGGTFRRSADPEPSTAAASATPIAPPRPAACSSRRHSRARRNSACSLSGLAADSTATRT
jgi:hypothetical protein